VFVSLADPHEVNNRKQTPNPVRTEEPPFNLIYVRLRLRALFEGIE
jgi:hypothetical protein